MFDRSKTYYKVINKELKHYGLKYKKGLVIDSIPFNDDPKASCVPGGIYFTDMEYITNFFHYGYWVYAVTIPNGAKVIKNRIKWRADKVVLGKRWNKFDFYMQFKPKINGWLDLRDCTLPVGFIIGDIEGSLNFSKCITHSGIIVNSVGNWHNPFNNKMEDK